MITKATSAAQRRTTAVTATSIRVLRGHFDATLNTTGPTTIAVTNNTRIISLSV